MNSSPAIKISKSAKKHTTFIKNKATFIKKHPINAKKCKNLQKRMFHPQQPPFLTTPKTKNPI